MATKRQVMFQVEDEIALLDSDSDTTRKNSEDRERESQGRTGKAKSGHWWWAQWAIHASLIVFYFFFLRTKANASVLTCEVPRTDIGGTAVSYIRHGFDEGHGENVPVVYDNGTVGSKRVFYYSSKKNSIVDENWKKSYNDVMFMRITKEEADKLPVKTVPLIDGSGYLSGLDVFHQLHCLDAIRDAFDPENYKSFLSKDAFHQHLGHCINYIRQGVVCNADITPLSFYEVTDPEDPGFERYTTTFGNKHVCRDFQKIYDFAYERRIRKDEESRLLDKPGFGDNKGERKKGGDSH